MAIIGVMVGGKTVHLLCGVPASGKTWVARQLSQFNWVPHDDFQVNVYHSHLIRATYGGRPVLGEAPFRISVLKEQLENSGVKVVTYYITEPECVIKSRYEKRDGKAWPKQHSTNLARYDQRDWDFKGTPIEVLEKLRAL